MLRVVAGERAVLEDRIGEQIRRRHRHDQAVVLQAFLKSFMMLLGFGGRGVDGDQIVVVKVHAVRADFAEQIADLRRARSARASARRTDRGRCCRRSRGRT